MPPISADQVSSIVEAGADLLREAGNLTSGRDPNYIRDAQPGNAIDAIALAAARQGCRRYQQKGGDYSGRRAARAERACRPYLESLEPGKGIQIEQPFRGGQCVAQYTATWQSRSFNQSTQSFEWVNSSFSGNLTGPVSVRNAATNTSCTTPGQTRQEWLLVRGTGVSATILASGCADVVPSYRNLVLTRVGGLPDNCGNPPPEVVPPSNPTSPLPPGPQPFTRGTDVDVNIDVTINPDFSINVNVGTGPVTIDPFADPVLTDPGGGGGDDGPNDGPAGDPGAPGAPVTTGPGGDAEGAAPAGSVLVGVRVEVLTIPTSRARYTEEVYRGAYYVYMGTPGLLALHPSGAMVTVDQFTFADKDNLTRWRVRANDKWSIRATPYYREIE